MRLTMALIVGFVMLSLGCERGGDVGSGGAPLGSTASGNGSPAAIDALPSPKTHVTFQSKYTQAIPVEGGKSAYVTVNQWVFVPDGKDESLICISDSEHCITLVALQELLNRPANDPLGIRPVKP